MFNKNYFLAILVVLAIILIAILDSHKYRWWACGALAGLAVGTALGWWMAEAPPGAALKGLWRPSVSP